MGDVEMLVLTGVLSAVFFSVLASPALAATIRAAENCIAGLCCLVCVQRYLFRTNSVHITQSTPYTECVPYGVRYGVLRTPYSTP